MQERVLILALLLVPLTAGAQEKFSSPEEAIESGLAFDYSVRQPDLDLGVVAANYAGLVAGIESRKPGRGFQKLRADLPNADEAELQSVLYLLVDHHESTLGAVQAAYFQDVCDGTSPKTHSRGAGALINSTYASEDRVKAELFSTLLDELPESVREEFVDALAKHSSNITRVRLDFEKIAKEEEGQSEAVESLVTEMCLKNTLGAS